MKLFPNCWRCGSEGSEGGAGSCSGAMSVMRLGYVGHQSAIVDRLHAVACATPISLRGQINCLAQRPCSAVIRRPVAGAAHAQSGRS